MLSGSLAGDAPEGLSCQQEADKPRLPDSSNGRASGLHPESGSSILSSGTKSLLQVLPDFIKTNEPACALRRRTPALLV